YGPDKVWDNLPKPVQEDILEKELDLHIIDAYEVAEDTGMGQRINTIMQTCFFAISGVLPREQAVEEIKKAIRKSYGKRGEAVVQKNFAAVDQALENLYHVEPPQEITSQKERRPPVTEDAPAFVKEVLGTIIEAEGDSLPVSALPEDGTYPTGTTKYEKRNIALQIPVWEPDLCIQCGKCVMVCPHAVIRQKVYDPKHLEDAPETFKSTEARFREFPDTLFTLQVAPEECTGCEVCVEACPVKDKSEVGRKAINMAPQPPIREQEGENWDYFLSIPDVDRTKLKTNSIKNAQLLQPLFEFSGACAGCGETSYVKLATQLFGDRMVIANATGCSSIYGGNLPTHPYTTNEEGRGPAWNNSLFEDNAEFGMGMRLTMDKQNQYARELLQELADDIGPELTEEIRDADMSEETGIHEQRSRVKELKKRLQDLNDPKAKDLLTLADKLVKKSVWIIGGDGWAYDIGYGGLDHVLASRRNVNVLVLDTQVYSNTGGQSSKATPLAAVAKFAANGKEEPRKDLGMMAMSYGYIYVAQVAMGASDTQTLKAFREAESYDGPSLIIAYSPCIAHGYDMKKSLEHSDLAVKSGLWPLYRYDPRLAEEGKNPLQLDSRAPSIPLTEFAYNETRYRMLLQTNEERAEKLMEKAQEGINERWTLYQQMANLTYSDES
ncbi:MAG: pyruvate:ferredoxin (flavodoxin) oxidoreductase, partial [Anaerolineales bacterium]|nr:pyruvate:ferredoxin (flavodoxin) oxidoreductase [Anaerolineales bacterium]